MKKIIKLFLCLLTVSQFASCDKNVTGVIVEEGTRPVLNANRNVVNIAFLTKDDEALTLTWTNPAYRFSTGISSHDVTYLVEIDTTGAKFTNPSRKTISISKELSVSFTQNVLNDYLLNQLTLVPGIPHNIEMRVTASLRNNALPLSSNVLKYTVTPYAIPAKVAPPSTGRLFIVGNATPGGWNNPVPVPTQEFTRISNTLYTITVAITGGNSYLFLPLNGDWGVKYGGVAANNANIPTEDDFKIGGGDLMAPSASGNYKIEVDFQRGKYKLTKL